MDATFSGLGTPVDVLTARLVGWLAFWAVAPHFSWPASCPLALARLCLCVVMVRCAAF